MMVVTMIHGTPAKARSRMTKIVSVDKSYRADGDKYFVTMQNDDGSTARVEVGEAEAKRFEKAMRENKSGGLRYLTEA
jgi:hypothetical protein